MKASLAAASLILLPCAFAHRLDEYLQATTLSLEKGRVLVQIRLTPGVAVLPAVMTGIDTDANGAISPREERAYAERVLADLSLMLDGEPLRLELLSTKFPKAEAIKEGLGEMQIDFAAKAPGGNPARKLVFENRHQKSIAAYLVNALVPDDPGIRVTAQNRDYEQSRYELDYVQGSWWGDGRAWLASVALALLVRHGLLWRRRLGQIPPPTKRF